MGVVAAIAVGGFGGKMGWGGDRRAANAGEGLGTKKAI